MSALVAETRADWGTPEEDAATLTLLRAPAAIAAACFLGGAILGQAVWSSATPEARTFAVLRCLAVGAVCLPFLLPSKHYRPGRAVMRFWNMAAAVAASARSIQLVVSLWPLPPGAWLIAAAMQVGLMVIVWLAVFAVRRSG